VTELWASKLRNWDSIPGKTNNICLLYSVKTGLHFTECFLRAIFTGIKRSEREADHSLGISSQRASIASYS
jgi:hypothetical protein